MRTVSLSGTHYEMGRQHGLQTKVLRPLIVKAIEAKFGQIEQDGPDERFEYLLRDTMTLLREVDSPILEMIRGQAEGLEIEFETLLRYGLVTHLRDALVTRKRQGDEGCTTWAAAGPATADRKPILAKNRDYSLEHLPLQLVAKAQPQVGHRYAYITGAGSPGVFCAGMNEAGLAIADTHVCSTDIGPGMPDYSLMLHILEEHSSVSSALDYLRSVTRMGRNNLILADARGHLAVFEIGHRSYGLFAAQDGVLVNTNHFASPELRCCFVDTNPPATKGNSFHRYERVARELNAALGQIDVPFAQRLMATHDGLLASICRHPRADGDSATVSASVFLPTQQTMVFCQGLTCQGHYDGFVLERTGLEP